MAQTKFSLQFGNWIPFLKEVNKKGGDGNYSLFHFSLGHQAYSNNKTKLIRSIGKIKKCLMIS
jgi:hypothetical protein